MDAGWRIDGLDLDGYLARLGISRREPSSEALDELHEAHVRTFTFDDINVLLQQHPGVDLDAVRSTSTRTTVPLTTAALSLPRRSPARRVLGCNPDQALTGVLP